ncbi:MAG: tRNA (5-methylaminomethyl-2-thiouridine)(34)-methyltransferase MnmD [Pseudomonadota bacterium]
MDADAARDNLNRPSLRWEDGVPVSVAFDDPYYARSDGLAETRHVFLGGNALPERFMGADSFRLAELGFGTGLNFLAALHLWRAIAPAGAMLHATSFELYPMTTDEMARALAPWTELAADTQALLLQWPSREIVFDQARLRIIVGDARETLAAWQGCADAWFLDGFAPARNPELWEPALLQAVFDRTAPGGTAATYSAAGAVRRALAAAGFCVTKTPGFGTKRDMTTARRHEVSG